MDIIHCPNCDEPLSGTPDYCPKCGEYLSLPELKTPESSIIEDPTIPIAPGPEDPTAPKVPSTALDENGAKWRVGIFTPPNYLLVSILVIVGLLCGGLLDITIAFGHLLGSQSSLNLGDLSLQSSSSSVAFGGTITLHGSNFTSYGQVGLTRDINVPIFDTQKRNIIRADAQGTFTDTINVDPAWLAGLRSTPHQCRRCSFT